MRIKKWSRRGLRQSLILALALFLLLHAASCTQDTQAKGVILAQIGRVTVAEMAQYYEGLAQEEEAIYRAILFTNRALLKPQSPGGIVQIDKETRDNEAKLKDLRDRLSQQFGIRARAAKQLANTYTALQNLASYDATAEAQRAAGALATELQSLEVLPKQIFPAGASAVSVDGLAKTAAGLLFSAKQSRDIRKGSGAIETTLREWQKMVAGEAPAYKARSETYLLVSKTLVGQLIFLQQFGGNALFKDTLDLFHVIVAPGELPSGSAAHKLAVQEVIDEQYEMLRAAAYGVPTYIESALTRLLDEHQKFREQQPLTVGELAAELNRLKETLDVVFPPKKEGV